MKIDVTARVFVEIIPSKKLRALLTRDYRFSINDRAGIIPAGFETDFASSPPSVWFLIPPVGKYLKAALIHDYFYSKQQFAGQPCSKEYADEVFYDIMVHEGVAGWRRKIMYTAVKYFGQSRWNKCLIKNQDEACFR